MDAKERFRHPQFRARAFEDVPVNREVYLADEKWIPEYEAARIELFNGAPFRNVGYISYAAVRSVGNDSIELSWFPNLSDRFHEVLVRLPREAFLVCVDTPRWDERPRIFVKSAWLSRLHLRPYSFSAFADWQLENMRRLTYRAMWERFFESADVFLLPTTFTVAFPHDRTPPDQRMIPTPEGGAQNFWNLLTYIAPASLTGCPATTAPAGLALSGLPVGLQIVGPISGRCDAD